MRIVSRGGQNRRLYGGCTDKGSPSWPSPLGHTIVPSNDKISGAAFLGDLFYLEPESKGHFGALCINEHSTFDYETGARVDSQHYAFVVSDEAFDAIMGGFPFGQFSDVSVYALADVSAALSDSVTHIEGVLAMMAASD